jgi:hypothetical protein
MSCLAGWVGGAEANPGELGDGGVLPCGCLAEPCGARDTGASLALALAVDRTVLPGFVAGDADWERRFVRACFWLRESDV